MRFQLFSSPGRTSRGTKSESVREDEINAGSGNGDDGVLGYIIRFPSGVAAFFGDVLLGVGGGGGIELVGKKKGRGKREGGRGQVYFSVRKLKGFGEDEGKIERENGILGRIVLV